MAESNDQPLPLTVLVAHGNTLHLKQAVEDLQRLGLDVVATPDGGDAFARFFEETPRLVICSENLPSLSGLNFAQMVRSQSPETTVILLRETNKDFNIPDVLSLADPLNVSELNKLLPTLIPDAPRTPTLTDIHKPSSSVVFTQAALKRFQRDNHLLAVLDDRGIDAIAELAQHQVRKDGECIIREGDVGDGFYLLVEGQVRVTLKDKSNAEIARIGAGGFFGEMALLSDQRRSASVWAVGDTTLLFFERQAFLPILRDHPTMREILSGVALRRTEENLWRVLFDDADVQKSLAELSNPASDNLSVQTEEKGEDTLPEMPIPSPLAHDDSLTPANQERVGASQRRRRKPTKTNKRGISLFKSNYDPHITLVDEPIQVQTWFQRYKFIFGVAAGVACGVLASQLLTPTPVDNTPTRFPSPLEPSETPADANKEPDQAPEIVATPPSTAVKNNPAPSPESLSESAATEKKQLRRNFLKFYVQGQYKEAAELGERFAKTYGHDWETHFILAETMRQLEHHKEAIVLYKDFMKTFAGNAFIDDAQFWLAFLLQGQGETEQAKKLYETVLANPKSKFRTAAERELQKM